MKQADLIVLAGTVVTGAGGTGPKNKAEAADIGLIKDGAVVTKDGIIIEVGTRSEILEVWGGDRLDLPNTSVIPGLVDPHCHPLWAGDRLHEFTMRAQGASYEEIHAAGGGIAHTVEATRKAGTEELKSKLASVVDLNRCLMQLAAKHKKVKFRCLVASETLNEGKKQHKNLPIIMVYRDGELKESIIAACSPNHLGERFDVDAVEALLRKVGAFEQYEEIERAAKGALAGQGGSGGGGAEGGVSSSVLAEAVNEGRKLREEGQVFYKKEGGRIKLSRVNGDGDLEDW